MSNWHYSGVDVHMEIRLVEKYFSISRRSHGGNTDWYFKPVSQATRASQEKLADQHCLDKICPGISDDDSDLDLEGDSEDAMRWGGLD